MDREPDVLTMLLLDPCLTADEAAREAAARRQVAVVLAEARRPPRAKRGEPTHAEDGGPAVGF